MQNVGNEIALIAFASRDPETNPTGAKVILELTRISRENMADIQDTVNDLEVSLNCDNFQTATEVCIECGVKSALKVCKPLTKEYDREGRGGDVFNVKSIIQKKKNIPDTHVCNNTAKVKMS